MQAAGRDASGSARTALGFLYQLVGARDFFARMHELGDGMLFDSRVLFAHLGWRPSAPDRFASDLFQPEAIEHPGVREFTVAARDAGFPLLLGGQTLVSGVTVSFAFGTESARLRCELSPTTSTRALPPSRIWPCLTRIRIVEARRSLAVFAETVSL